MLDMDGFFNSNLHIRRQIDFIMMINNRYGMNSLYSGADYRVVYKEIPLFIIIDYHKGDTLINIRIN